MEAEEVLTVTGLASFCLCSPARQDPLHADKGDLWRAWHFHLAQASSHWLTHSFQLTPALYVASGPVGMGSWGFLLQLDGSAFSGNEDAHAGLRSLLRTGTDELQGCTHKTLGKITHTEASMVGMPCRQRSMQKFTLFLFFSLPRKNVSSWEDIGKTWRMLCCRGWTDHLGTVLVGPCLMWTDQPVDFHFFLSFFFFFHLPHSWPLIGCTPPRHIRLVYTCVIQSWAVNHPITGWAGLVTKQS